MHDNYTLLMSLVLDGEATPEEEARLLSHVRGCAECSSTWQRWQEFDRRFDSAPMVVAPAGLSAQVMARIAAYDAEAETGRSRAHRLAFWFSVAWAFVLVIAGLLGFAVANWPVETPGAITAALSGITAAVAWIWRLGAAVVARAGLPAVAAAAGATVSLTCVLAAFWLWVVNRGVAYSKPARSVA